MFEYAFTDSPSLFGMDNKESKGWGTLHIKASSWEWILFELTYMFYRIRSAIINGERSLMESSRKFCLFYPLCEGWLRNLTQCLFHNVSSHSFTRKAPAFSPVMALFIIGEWFAWWSSWPLSVNSVFFLIRKDIGVGKGSPLLYSIELLLQVINLSLRDFIIISPIGEVASLSKVASTSMGGMYATFLMFFPISFTLEIEDIILLVKIRRFCLMRTCWMWTWSCHS